MISRILEDFVKSKLSIKFAYILCGLSLIILMGLTAFFLIYCTLLGAPPLIIFAFIIYWKVYLILITIILASFLCIKYKKILIFYLTFITIAALISFKICEPSIVAKFNPEYYSQQAIENIDKIAEYKIKKSYYVEYEYDNKIYHGFILDINNYPLDLWLETTENAMSEILADGGDIEDVYKTMDNVLKHIKKYDFCYKNPEYDKEEKNEYIPVKIVSWNFNKKNSQLTINFSNDSHITTDFDEFHKRTKYLDYYKKVSRRRTIEKFFTYDYSFY